MRSRPGGSPILRWMGTLARPGLFARCLWPAAVALALAAHGSGGRRGRAADGRAAGGLSEPAGRVVGGSAALAACGLYFASAISFWVIRETLTERWAQICSLRDRWRDRREERAEMRAENETLRVERNQPVPFPKLVTADGPEEESEPPVRLVEPLPVVFHAPARTAARPA